MTSMIEIRGIIIESQIEFLKRNNQPYLDTPEARMLFLLKTALTSKVMYMEAASFDVPAYHEHIAAYEDSLIEGRTGSPWADGFVLILAIIGGWWLLRYFNTQSLLIYSMLITSGIFLFATVPLPWQRYYLILQIPYALMAGAGASQLWVWGKKALNSQPIKTEPAP